MEKTARAYSFLFSALITLLSFVIAAAIAMNLFSLASKISYSSENKTLAVNIAQERLEEIIAKLPEETGGDEGIFAGEKKSEERVIKIWSNKEREFKVTSGISGQKASKGALYKIKIKISGKDQAGNIEDLVEVETSKFIR